jgi:arylsulfatase A-like enzyme
MSGHNPLRNGAWATCWGRSILRKDEVTMADVFAANGYRTGMFGKWHLGDNYPYRPQDRGFQTVVAHRGGGVGQTPDFWGNNYFDDTYFHNGQPVAHEGYCTDIWFDEAMKFIEDSRDRPFFCYLATNAPHSPYLVEDSYTRPYADNPDVPHPAFYGMIGSIDENMGRLVKRVADLGLEENTILIFMTDNGSSGGCVQDERGFLTQGYSAGMRGKKGSLYDGGHRVPFFMRWPPSSCAGRPAGSRSMPTSGSWSRTRTCSPRSSTCAASMHRRGCRLTVLVSRRFCAGRPITCPTARYSYSTGRTPNLRRSGRTPS